METKWILITIKMIYLLVKMSSYEFVGEKILAKGFADKKEKAFVRL